jgi:hypothetical protein
MTSRQYHRHLRADGLDNVGTFMSHNPAGLNDILQGYLYLPHVLNLSLLNRNNIITIVWNALFSIVPAMHCLSHRSHWDVCDLKGMLWSFIRKVGNSRHQSPMNLYWQRSCVTRICRRIVKCHSYSMELTPSREASSCAATQQLLSIL